MGHAGAKLAGDLGRTEQGVAGRQRDKRDRCVGTLSQALASCVISFDLRCDPRMWALSSPFYRKLVRGGDCPSVLAPGGGGQHPRGMVWL